MEPLDRHIPINGPNGTYCSPACGFKCTRHAYERAMREADALAIRLGPGWEPRVWENWGWHYEAIKGAARVHPTSLSNPIVGDWVINGYTCFFNTARQVVTHAETPEDALGFAIQEARGIERQIAKDCGQLIFDTDGEY